MPGSWIIVEDTEQAEAAIRLVDQDARRRCVTTTAGAYYSLTKRSVPAVSLHTYLTFNELNKISENSEVYASRSCNRLDTEFRMAYPHIAENFKPFDALLYQFQRVLCVFSLRYEELTRFCQDERPNELLFWNSSQEMFDMVESNLTGANRQPFTFKPNETITSVLLHHTHWNEQFDIHLMPLYSEIHSTLDEPAKLIRFRSLLKSILNMNRWRGFGTIGWHSIKPKWRDLSRIVVLDSGANVLDFVIHAISRKEVTIDWWTNWQVGPVSLRTGLGVKLPQLRSNGFLENWNESKIREMVEGAWVVADNDLSEPVSHALKSRLEQFALIRIPMLASLYQRSVQYFRKRRPVSACCGGTTGDALQIIAQAARQVGVPVMTFQHGGNVGYVVLRGFFTSDLKVPDIFCTYGDGVSETLDKQTKDHGFSTKVVTIGWRWQGQQAMYRFGKRKQSRSQPVGLHAGTNKRILMYVSTGLLGNNRHGPHYWYDDTAYFIHQTELVSLLMKQTEFEIIIKLHYKDKMYNPIKDYVKDHGLDKIRIMQKQHLSTVLPKADLVLIDWPSTTLLEALAMNRRVIYLDLGLLKWIPEARNLLKRNTCWIDKKEGWQDIVLQALKNPSCGQGVQLDNAFSKAYAISDYNPTQVWTIINQLRTQYQTKI